MTAAEAESLPEEFRIRTETQVMFFDTDCAAVVHNLAYLRFIETARTLLAEQLGMDLRVMAATGEYPVLLRTEVDYKRPAVLGDKLIVRGWIDKVDRIRFWCAFEVVRPSDGTVMVHARQALAVIKMPEAKPIRLPEAFVQRCKSVPALTAGS